MCNDNRRVTKVKYNGKRVVITYESLRGADELDEYQMSCSEEPRPGFRNALAELAPHVARICECPKKWSEGMEIIGVSLSYKSDVLGVVITASKPLEMTNAPMTFNTPHLTDSSYNGDDESVPTMPKAMSKAVDEVVKEAIAYIDGQRAQMQMFTEEN